MQKPVVLLISQVYVPDPAAVGQYLHDVAAATVRRGFHVRMLTASRGYDAPEVSYPRRETIDGVDVIRLPLSSFGKRSILIRLVAQLSFLAQAVVHGLLMRRLGVVLVSTSPPMCSVAGLVLGMLRRVPIVYWVMDINPDEAIAMGTVRGDSRLVRLFHLLNRTALAKAHSVVTLDRFMAMRLLRKRDISSKLTVFPPWPLENHLEAVPHEINPFRRAIGLEGKFVVMYSGNHSRMNPLSTVIRAAASLAHRRDIVFVFVGGGKAKTEVEDAIARGATNTISLPYQPLSELKHSLSAADVHVVTLGDRGVGIVHPCKIYGAMALGRPVLAVAPRPSHVTDLLDSSDMGRHVNHDDVDGLVRAIVELAAMGLVERAAMGSRGRALVQDHFSKRLLCGRFVDIVEAALRESRGRALPYQESLQGEAQASSSKGVPGEGRQEA